METVKFDVMETSNDRRLSLVAKVPPPVQEGLEFKYPVLLKKIDKAQSKGIKIKDLDDGLMYVFDSRTIGGASSKNHSDNLISSMELILAIQHMAQRSKMSDPDVRLGPTVNRHMGVFPLTAKTHWNGASRILPDQMKVSVVSTMATIYKDLMNPKGGEVEAAKRVDVKIHPVSGVTLGVGDPRDEISSGSYVVGQPVLELGGHMTSREHSLIVMAGVVALSGLACAAAES